jgi:hypothetical protein
MCAATIDGEYSLADYRAVRKLSDVDEAPSATGERELMVDEATNDGLPLSLEAELDAVDLDEREPERGPADDEGLANEGTGPAAADDVRSAVSAELLSHLQHRVDDLSDRYPFVLESDDALCLREDLTDDHRLYLFLLLASNLKYLSKGQAQQVTTAFELLSPYVLRSHLGEHAEAHLFGTSVREDVDRYAGSLWTRLEALSGDVHFPLQTKREEVETNYSGDNGLDVVGWLKSGDNTSRIVVVFGQCACGRSWQNKMHEASADHWAPVFTFTVPLVNVLLIPYSARNADGSWFNEYRIPKGVVIDRERIMARVAIGDLAEADSPTAFVDDLLAEELA